MLFRWAESYWGKIFFRAGERRTTATRPILVNLRSRFSPPGQRLISLNRKCKRLTRRGDGFSSAKFMASHINSRLLTHNLDLNYISNRPARVYVSLESYKLWRKWMRQFFILICDNFILPNHNYISATIPYSEAGSGADSFPAWFLPPAGTDSWRDSKDSCDWDLFIKWSRTLLISFLIRTSHHQQRNAIIVISLSTPHAEMAGCHREPYDDDWAVYTAS